jgi:hypothetical protein
MPQPVPCKTFARHSPNFYATQRPLFVPGGEIKILGEIFNYYAFKNLRSVLRILSSFASIVGIQAAFSRTHRTEIAAAAFLNS